jgi:heat shock protein beta
MKKYICALMTCAKLSVIFSMFAAPVAHVAAATSLQRQAQQIKPNIIAKINFDPKVNGFGFQNYTNSKHVWQDDMNAGDMIRLFGAGAVCSKGSTAQNCVMKAAAREWMMQTLENMNIGHCDGMATTSLLLATNKPFKGKARASQFQPAAETPFQLKLDPTIENYIAYYWATQTLSEIRNQRTKSRTDGPLAVVKTLANDLKSGKDVHTLIFWKSDKGKLSAGHVVSPFAVEDAGALYRIHVYDNNYPGQTRFITVEKEGKQTWKYVTTTNPSQPVSAYTGDITTKSLATTSNATREKGCFKVPFANDGKGGTCVPVKEAFVKPAPTPRKPIEYTAPARPKKPAQPKPAVSEVAFYEDEMAEFALNGYADLLVIDGEGYAVGVDPTTDQFVDEIPYSEVDWQTGGRGFDTPRYSVPYQQSGAPYTILISGKYNTKETNVDFTYSGPGFTIGFDGILVDPNEVIAMTVSPDGEQISFTSSADGETPEIYYAVDSGDRSTRFELDGGKLKPGKTLTVNYNTQSNIFNFSDNDGDADEYDVDYTRYNPDGTIWNYETDDIDFGKADRYQMDFSKWNGAGAVGAKADDEGDGFDDDEYIAQETEDNDNDADDADDEGDDEDSDIDNDGKLNADDNDDDNDGTPDAKDSDDDNDGLSDGEDSDNEDDDGDGKPDDEDADDDNDGTPDDKDLDDDNDGVADTDEDGEYNEDGEEDEVTNDDDDDNDGVPDAKDNDDDNDGISDGEDDDTTDDDGDGKPDDEDADDDNDGTPDDKDIDDDNDGVSDEDEEEGDEESEVVNDDDDDDDGISDSKDFDDDNDGIPDAEDEDTTDDDGDGTPDDKDTDDDNDGTDDDEDTDDDNDGEPDDPSYMSFFARLLSS